MAGRYDDVKVLLKEWERSFVREHKRKPDKDDVHGAPEETKKLYKEYQALKEAKENSGNGTASKVHPAEVQTAVKDDCWGSHLSRKNMPAAAPKLSSEEKVSLQASALYFGMKLKANIGSTVKERPVSLKKSFSVGRTPLKSRKDSQDPLELAQPKPANTCPGPLSPAQTASSEPSPAFAAPEAWSPAPDEPARRAQQLRRSVTRRLSSVDSGWLQRCRVFDEVGERERPVAGNAAPAGSDQLLATNGGEEGSNKPGPPASAKSTPPAPRMGNVTSSGGTACLQDAGPGPSLWCPDGETRPALGGEEPGGTELSGAISGARKPRPGARKGQEGGKECEQTEDGESGRKGVKRRVRKRRRDQEDEEEVKAADGGTAKRRRKMKKAEGNSESLNKAARGRRNNGEGPEGPGKDEVKRKPAAPRENLLGEVDEEDVRAARSRDKNVPRAWAPKNTDGNFVKINLKKKSHVKGFALRGAALRKQMYVQKFQLKGERFGGGRGRGRFGGFSRHGDTCFKCGGTGHWAQSCPGRPPAPAVDGGATEQEEEPFELPTLEEVARATGTLRSEPVGVREGDDENVDKGEEILLNVVRPDYERPAPPPPMEPLYGLGEDGKVREPPPEVYEALNDFGYRSFRPGQEVAIMRILSGLSTLVVLSTGMGKSLCYQLPAYLYAKRSGCVTLVLSPLVSLMDDQVSGLPSKLKAACIHSNMSPKQREKAIEKVKAGQVHVLLLSPEALVGGGHSSSGCLPPADQLPPVAFACIDEAHCVSEWSHNFRPCYLRLCKVLRDRLGVRCLLGLTATATLSTALDIGRHLEINDQDGIAVRSAAVPPNLQLSVSTDRDKDQALVSLLKGERFGALESIIVYCTRREETTRIAALLRTCLQGVMLRESSNTTKAEDGDNPVAQKKRALAKKKIRKPLKWLAESYHAGMSAAERKRVQVNFMCGELRLVVATVAFGMGLDKSDVRGIVHYNMPKSFESYVQEIGRAGRDGGPAHCHLFLDPEGEDLHELRRHIYTDTVDYFTVKKLVQKVFPSCKCRQIHQKHQEMSSTKMDMEVDDADMLELMDICDGVVHEQQEQNKSPCDGNPEGQNSPPNQPLDEGEKKTENLEEGSSKGGEGEEASSRTEGEENAVVTHRVCHTHERAIPIQETVEALDISEEGLETLLCYLELHPQQWVELMHPTLSICKMTCYGGPQQLRKLTKLCPPVAVALARMRMAGQKVEACDSLEFDVVELSDTMGWQMLMVKKGLRQLQWGSGSFGGTGRSGVHVEFSGLSFYFRSYGDLTAEEMDRVCAFLHGRVVAQEKTQLYQLEACFRAFRSVAYRTCDSCLDRLDEERSPRLKRLLGDYFEKRRERNFGEELQPYEDDDDSLNRYKMRDWEEQVRADVRSFLSARSDERFSGRAVARVFHGIGSPCYPAQTYGRDRRYWRKYIRFDFNQLIRIATQEIIRTK
ncbi:ATP-dependent DNA helicase Q4 isoform X2 [Denticeps clupeoides]|uniref:ATP-dependent DNA helicase Q4 isoform X2 n=1 Tax=Denticeps clupeoides TaxID=299321 RepID=UPI0010A51299|nr:ATP-dependent DNA helicase Q4 isoform X2 [Denticeps clupeoides]